MRGSLGAIIEHEREDQHARVEHVAVGVLVEGLARLGPAVRHDPLVGGVARRRASVRVSAGRPRLAWMRIARSNATQVMIREYVKSRRPPRTSQMPSSG